MSLRGPTVTFLNSSLGLQDISDIAGMPAGMMVPPRLLHPSSMPLQPKNIFSTSGLTLAPPTGLEGRCNASETLDSELMKSKEEFDSKSTKSSNSLDGGSAGEDQESEQRPSKKRYHRHSIY
eukprot:c48840_g1_i1 orf=1-363(-)